MELKLSHFINQLTSVGGILRCGQPGFCLLFALWDKAVELNSLRFSVSNMELASRAGFAGSRRFFEVRKVLKDDGFLEFESVKGCKSLSYYSLNTDFAVMTVNSTVISTNNGMDNGMDDSIDNGMDDSMDSSIDNGMDDSMDSSIDNGMDDSMDSSMDNGMDDSTDSSIDSSTDNGIKSLVESFCKRSPS